MAKNPFNIGIFNGPSYSGFSIKHGNRVSTKAGVMKPVWCDYLDTGERLKDFDLGALIRQAPMLAPTLDTYEVTVDAFAVRLRTLGMAGRNPWVYEDFFNYNKNVAGNYRLPMFSLGRFWAWNNPLKLGTLYESLNYPSWKWLREQIFDKLRSIPWAYNPVAKFYTLGFDSDAVSFAVAPVGLKYDSSEIPLLSAANLAEHKDFTLSFGSVRKLFCNVTLQGMSASDFDGESITDYESTFPSLVAFAAARYPSVVSQGYHDEIYGLYSLFTYDVSTEEDGEKIAIAVNNVPSFNILDKVYELYHVDALSVIAEYEDYVIDNILHLVADDVDVLNYVGSLSEGAVRLYDSSYRIDTLFSFVVSWLLGSMRDCPSEYGETPGLFEGLAATFHDQSLEGFGWPNNSSNQPLVDRFVPDYYFNAYWKVISDWYINTAIFQPDDFYLDHYMDNNKTDDDTSYSHSRKTNELFFRYWKNDYFTSAFPNSQLGSAVGIPVNGTIIDFRNANSWQKLRERLMYAGSRFRDVLFAMTGKRTSSAIMDMSEPLGRWKSIVNVDSVLQTSQSSSSSPQAGYSGTGMSYKMDGRSVSYTAEEPTVIIVMMNINPVSSAYFDGFPRKFARWNLYQYDVAQLANVGEQQIYKYELFLGPDPMQKALSYNGVFGWQRRYGDFMWTQDEVHGDFRGSLDYWHNARTFVNAPALSERFLQVRPNDDNLNRQYAVSSPVVDKFYCHVFFDGHIIRHLPKHAYYDL